MQIAITGHTIWPRSIIAKKLESLGHTFTPSLTKANLLLVGKEPGSKYDKALLMGKTCKDLFDWLQENGVVA